MLRPDSAAVDDGSGVLFSRFQISFPDPWADVSLAKNKGTFCYIELGVARGTLNHVLPVGTASTGCKRAAGRLLTPSGGRARSV